jgi:hypothetical protein
MFYNPNYLIFNQVSNFLSPRILNISGSIPQVPIQHARSTSLGVMLTSTQVSQDLNSAHIVSQRPCDLS